MENSTSLHDELLRDLQETGMYGLATEMGIVRDGVLPEVRMHEERRSGQAVMPRSQLSLPLEPDRGAAEERQGQELIAAADFAAQSASKTADQVHQRMTGGRSAQDGQLTPRRKKRGPPSGQGGNSSGNEGTGILPGVSSRAGSKGLRHFSMKVCEKVESKQRTTYNEVADELVAELPLTSNAGSPKQYDEKNIRRRVYDALNVLMAMDIIAKHKKEILWRGLPHNQTTAIERLKGDRQRLANHINKQRAYIQELQKQQAAYRGLLQRNRQQPLHLMQASQAAAKPTALPLPFVLIQVDPDAVVEIQISDDSRVAHFDFQSTPFRMIGDEDVLYSLGLHELAKATSLPEDGSTDHVSKANADATPLQEPAAAQPKLKVEQSLLVQYTGVEAPLPPGRPSQYKNGQTMGPQAMLHSEAERQQHIQHHQQPQQQQQQANGAGLHPHAMHMNGHDRMHGHVPGSSLMEHSAGGRSGPAIAPHSATNAAYNPMMLNQGNAQPWGAVHGWMGPPEAQQHRANSLPSGNPMTPMPGSSAPNGHMLQSMLQQMQHKSQMSGQDGMYRPEYAQRPLEAQELPAAHLHQHWGHS